MEDTPNNGNGKNAMEDVEEETHLPDEIITQHILPRLPIKPLVRCKLLSKQWGHNINFALDHKISSNPPTPIESLFIQSGNTFYLYSCTNLDDDENVENNLVELNPNLEGEGMFYNIPRMGDIKLVGSSNGLVCLGEKKARYFYLYNPITNQSHKFYPGDFDFWNNSSSRPCTSWGFGYVSSIDDFKVVRIILSYQNRQVSIVHVYSLRSNIWSKVECCIEEGDMIIGGANLVNETLYWGLVRGRNLAFDLSRDTFKFIPYLPLDVHVSNGLCVMGGCLSKWSSYSENELKFEILKYPGRVDSVVFSCDLDIMDFKQFVGFTKTGKVFYAKSLGGRPGVLSLIDQRSMRTLLTFNDKEFRIATHTPTQISPHPAAELPNEPPEGTWPVYQPPEPPGPVHFVIPEDVQLENPPDQADFIILDEVQLENVSDLDNFNMLDDPADFIMLEDVQPENPPGPN